MYMLLPSSWPPGTTSKCAAGGFSGAVLGIILASLVNVTLAEIALSDFFALYFGVMFICLGSWIIHRTLSGRNLETCRKSVDSLVLLAALVTLAGVLCICLPRNIRSFSSTATKIPLYVVFGLSTAFSMAFTIIDIVNVLFGFFQSSVSKPLVQSVAQVRLVIFFAIVMGAVFGGIFGLLHTGERTPLQMRLALMRETNWCVGIGGVLGLIGGSINEMIRLTATQNWWQRIPDVEACETYI